MIVALSSFISEMLGHIYYVETKLSEVNYKDIFIESFIEIVSAENYFDFAKKIESEA